MGAITTTLDFVAELDVAVFAIMMIVSMIQDPHWLHQLRHTL